MRIEQAGSRPAPAGLDGRLGLVVRTVRDIYLAARPDTVTATGMLASALPDARSVIGLLREIVALHRAGAETAHGSSHIHRNGFTKVSLVRERDPGWNLRLHVWWEPARDAQIHDHRWDLASLVLAGSLRAVNYSTCEGDDYAIARYPDAAPGGSKSVELSGSCGLRPVASYTLSAGNTHSLSYTEPHILDHTETRPAATLVLTGPPRRGFSRAFVPRSDVVAGTARPPRMLDRDGAIGEVGKFADYLEGISGQPLDSPASWNLSLPPKET